MVFQGNGDRLPSIPFGDDLFDFIDQVVGGLNQIRDDFSVVGVVRSPWGVT
jgi:hypothetical protein